MKIRVSHVEGIIAIMDANTTIGYCRYDLSGEVEYLFVGAAFRRRGYAAKMLQLAEARLGIELRFAPPISPLGLHIVTAYSRDRQSTPLR